MHDVPDEDLIYTHANVILFFILIALTAAKFELALNRFYLIEREKWDKIYPEGLAGLTGKHFRALAYPSFLYRKC